MSAAVETPAAAVLPAQERARSTAAHRFRVLDSLRGLGALLVVVYHCQIWSHAFETAWFRHVQSLMDFFFVLSGFVISLGFYGRIRGWGDFAAYLLRRIGRIWPLHLAVLALFVALEAVKGAVGGGSTPAFAGAKSGGALLANILMIHGWNLFPTPTWNYPSWSISVEFAAYIVFGLFALAAPRRPILVALAIAAASTAIVAAFAPNAMMSDVDYGVPRCLAGFFLGHALFQLYRRRLAGRTWRLPFATAIEAVALLAAALYIGAVHEGPATLLSPLFYSAFVAVFLFEDGRLSALLSREPLRRLGEWSYSIYMIHAGVLLLAGVLLSLLQARTGLVHAVPAPDGARMVEVWSLGSLLGGDALTLAVLLATIGLSALSYRFVEEPGREAFNRLAGRIGRAGTRTVWHLGGRSVTLPGAGTLAAKRGCDIVLALAGLAALAPLLLATAAAVRATSPGPALFRQWRIGRDGRPFLILKFRTLRVEAEDSAGRVQAVEGDARLTPIGASLRRTSLDELPQLWNVVKGDMSLVGPRPHVPGTRAGDGTFETEIPFYDLRHAVRPGLTGLAQLRGFRGPTADIARARGRIEADLAYIETLSIAGDFGIILKTIRTEMTQRRGC